MTTTMSKKICLLGDFAVGKTSLVRRFVHNLFDDKYLSTIGVKVSRKSVSVVGDEQVSQLTLLLWDLAGSEEFSPMRASYLRGAAGAILVCDLTRAETLANLAGYVADLRQLNPTAQFVVAANKTDLTEQHQLTERQIEAVAADLKAPYYLTSAKTGDETESLFRCLGRLLLA